MKLVDAPELPNTVMVLLVIGNKLIIIISIV